MKNKFLHYNNGCDWYLKRFVSRQFDTRNSCTSRRKHARLFAFAACKIKKQKKHTIFAEIYGANKQLATQSSVLLVPKIRHVGKYCITKRKGLQLRQIY